MTPPSRASRKEITSGCGISVLWVVDSFLPFYWATEAERRGLLQVDLQPGFPRMCSEKNGIYIWVGWADGPSITSLLPDWTDGKLHPNGWGRTIGPEIPFRDKTHCFASLASPFCNQKAGEAPTRGTIKNPSRGTGPSSEGRIRYQGAPQLLHVKLAIKESKKAVPGIKINLEKIRTNSLSCPIPTQHLVD